MDLRAAADRLGVHYQTAYRWVRDGSLPAVKVGSAYLVDEDALARFREARLAPAPPRKRTAVRSWTSQRERLHRLLVEGDELEARQLVDRLRDGGIEPLALCEELLAPMMRQIGDEWAAGVVSVAVEHRASEIVERQVARMSSHPRGRPRGLAVVATVSGEEHSLPAAMAALVLRADRWQVHHLGTQVPESDLVALVRDVGAALVVLSVIHPEAVEATGRVAEVVRQRTDARVLVGGASLTLRDLVEAARATSPAAQNRP